MGNFLNQTPTVLVALLKEPQDWEIVLKHGIYRIRGSLRYPPAILTEKRIRLLAFYLPSKFKEHKFSVRHYCRVKRVSMAARSECVPDEPLNQRSRESYYRLDVDEPQQLEEPIVSFRGRSHMVLIPTTEQKLFNSPEFNFLYMSSNLEEKMWDALIDRNIFPERQFPVHTLDDNSYLLDFAIFCNKGNFAVEVDGPQHEATRDAVVYDKRRDNRLRTQNWEVFRYVPEDLEPKTMDKTLSQITKKIEDLDGLQTGQGLLPRKPIGAIDGQLSLFHEQHLDFLALRRRVREKYERS